MKLVQDWKLAWTWLSVHCMTIAAILSASSATIVAEWTSLPSEWQQILLNHFSVIIAFRIVSLISFLGIIGRLIQQKTGV